MNGLDFLGIGHHGFDLLAQAVQDPDILGQIQRGFQHFIASGQLGAMIAGIIVGYFIKTWTS